MTTWEYLQISWENWAVTNPDAPQMTEWFWKAFIHRGDQPETLDEKVSYQERLFEPMSILNTLGKEGWELVTIETYSGAYRVSPQAGFHAVPVLRKWWLKREANPER